MKFKDYKKLMFNLRMFDDPDPAGEGGNDPAEDPAKKEEDKTGGKKYDDAEVDRIVAKHKAEWEKKHAEDLKKATDEARKYERMTKEQKEAEDRRKADEEAAKKDARIKELLRRSQLTLCARLWLRMWKQCRKVLWHHRTSLIWP